MTEGVGAFGTTQGRRDTAIVQLRSAAGYGLLPGRGLIDGFPEFRDPKYKPENTTGRKVESEVGNESKPDELTAADAGAHWSAEIGGRGCGHAFQREKLTGRRVLGLKRARQPLHQPMENTRRVEEEWKQKNKVRLKIDGPELI
jgi:hypothetical protein